MVSGWLQRPPYRTTNVLAVCCNGTPRMDRRHPPPARWSLQRKASVSKETLAFPLLGAPKLKRSRQSAAMLAVCAHADGGLDAVTYSRYRIEPRDRRGDCQGADRQGRSRGGA